MSATTINWETCLAHAKETDVGMRRSNNQDSHRVQLAADVPTYLERGHLFVVADGMGAHAAGEYASKIAVEHIPHIYHKHRDRSPPEALVQAVIEANSEIHRRGEANSEFHNMGTTVSALLLLPQGAVVAHVGDSRVYRVRGGKIEQLTFDHSLVWEMRHGHLLGEQLEVGGIIPSNVITRSLGPKDHVQVDMEGPHPLELGDTFLLCSDGLSGQVPDDEIGPIVATLPPQEAARTLIDLANIRGGPDNITVVIAKVTGQQMVTGAVPADPLIVGGERTERVVHPALWVTMGVSALAALVMLMISLPIPAMVSGVAALVSLTAIILQLYGGLGKGEVALVGNRKLGKGPYTDANAVPNEEILERLNKLVEQLREATSGEAWDIDRNRFEGHVQKGEAYRKNGKFASALQEYAFSLRFMMQELRSQRTKRKTSDSSVEL